MFEYDGLVLFVFYVFLVSIMMLPLNSISCIFPFRFLFCFEVLMVTLIFILRLISMLILFYSGF
jgi:hypothetical protein